MLRSIVGVLSCVMLSAFLQLPCSLVRAELLPPEKLKDCELHVLGIYSPKNHGKDDRVFVEVQPTGRPIVLVMSGYFGAQWNVKIAPEADVRQVIIPGYFKHSVVGVPGDIPVETITWFTESGENRSDFFWAYAWHTEKGRELRERLKEITGLEITTFQGEYSGERFVVDGKQGLIAELEQVDAVTENSDPNLQKIASKFEDMLRTLDAEYQRVRTKFGDAHPAAQSLAIKIKVFEEELRRLNVAMPEVPTPANDKLTANEPSPLGDSRQTIENLVRKTFQLEMELQQARVEKAEADLQRVKAQLELRKKSAEMIIADRIDQLTKEKEQQTAEPESSDVPASLLASEGWAAWQKHDLRTALTKFQSALGKEPGNEAALNGLGWTYVHLAEYDKSIAEFKKLLKDSPSHPGALNGIGQSLLAKGDLDEAEKELRHATEDLIKRQGEAETAKRGVACWHGLVRTYLAKKNKQSAIDWAERSLKHKPDDPDMQSLLDQAKALPESDAK
ncbi:tetratricopeptide repeat protein [Stieleria varia]|uniref:Tetratricopeptide repeat protein n=1 Tax=Stieleria varia TaxID=2528005 RepID=A0A5C6BAZ5_9BACT|nr:tetratricopeptide repeat protein [Stieleria varia]TWU08449.1 Tetratricopeptide repeat protein [Stieleria varia]